MSFNGNDILITTANYEEYFLLYVDNELDATAKTAVEAFASQHPALAEELELLLSTRLPVDDAASFNKEFLLADSMKLNSVDESLLLYLDDELPATEREKVAASIAATPDLQFQYNLLQKAKLDKEEQVIYPYKKELYRSTKKVRSFYWMRVAAIVLLIAGASTITWFATTKNTQPPVAITNSAPQQPITKHNNAPAYTAPTEPVLQNIATASNKTETIHKQAKEKEQKATIPVEQRLTKKTEENELLATVGDEPVNVPTASINETTIYHNEAPQQIINKQPVTTATTASYHNTDTQPDVIDAAAVADSKRGRAIRGLLRKATRFIERTTNIDPVNEDDKLLIGAVALKLK